MSKRVKGLITNELSSRLKDLDGLAVFSNVLAWKLTP